MNPTATLPVLTSEYAGTGGKIKAQYEDFLVEEIPAYEPTGNGDHLYLWIEKTGLGAEYFLKLIAQRLQIPGGDIGTAGMKDRHAITRQWVSVPKEAEPRLPQLEGDGIRVLTVSRHNNKLRPGHLRGNRFEILIRGADEKAKDSLGLVITKLQQTGVPNFYGPQRFGRDGDTADVGLRLLRGEKVGRLPPFRLKLHLSAVQSLLFNSHLARRIREDLFRTVLAGDVMMKWPFGGLFVAQDVPVEQERFDRRETVIGGPMFGTKMFASERIASERENATLAEHNLTIESFGGFGKLLTGTRRHQLFYLDDLAASWESEGLRLKFTLPSGCYATVVLREIMKADVNAEDTEVAER